MMLLDALEVTIFKDPESDSKQKFNPNFNWDVIDFTDEFLKLKIDFESPEEIGSFR